MQWRSRVVDRHAATQSRGTMQCDSAGALLIKVLVNFVQIGFVIEVCAQCLAQRGQSVTSNDDNRAVDFSDYADLKGFIYCKCRIGQREGTPHQPHRFGKRGHDGTVIRRLSDNPGITILFRIVLDVALEIMNNDL